MLRLRTLGSPAVEAEGGPLGGAAAQRMSLALLALLAPGAERGVSRDKILAHLWPETEPEKAAHRLTQLLYSLRRDLKADSLFLGTSDLRLNPDIISIDLQQFGAARRAGDLERAVALYTGPFLDGFFLSGAVEFERWVESERAGLARDYSQTLETLAAEATAQGDPRKAAYWWKLLADHDPLSSRVTVHLMSALAAGGNRAGALEQARSYRELMEKELEAAPNPAVLALAEQLRQRPGEPAPNAARPRAMVAIAVLPFANLSPIATNDFFADGLTEELRSALARLDAVKVAARTSVKKFQDSDLDAQEIGQRLGVEVLLEGSIRQVEDRLRLTVQLVSVADGCHLWSEKYEREVRNVFAVQDELTELILKGVHGPLAQLRDDTSSS